MPDRMPEQMLEKNPNRCHIEHHKKYGIKWQRKCQKGGRIPG
jgi:hypothetical protein